MSPWPVMSGVSAPAKPYLITGLAVGALFSAAIALFIGGEILSDPGGVQGAGVVALWLGLPLGLAVIALVAPRAAFPVLCVLVAALAASALVGIFFARQVWEFEDSHGPVTLMALIGVLIPLVALGVSMPWRAGLLMAVAIAGSVVLESISLLIVAQPSVIAVFVVVMAPYAVSAAFYLIAGRVDRIAPSRP